MGDVARIIFSGDEPVPEHRRCKPFYVVGEDSPLPFITAMAWAAA